MTQVHNNPRLANQLATNIARSLDGLESVQAVISDTQTTVAGNTKAQEALHSARNATNLIIGAVGQASVALQTVAVEFEAADRALREGLAQIPQGNGGQS
ncbi:TIGR04197 family type VII secretion effector [Enterococcus sp. LJL51]|uniref:TIGR04197 family type VII secretion effector n=1 Tax=Enterococcus sp. LJL51 TaxID=3416656 RepID=UPI003CF18A13